MNRHFFSLVRPLGLAERTGNAFFLAAWMAMCGLFFPTEMHAQTGAGELKIPTRFLDIANKAFEGAFDINGVTGCSYDVNHWTTGLVADTLEVDSLTGKKQIKAGPKQVCSYDIENWFDPALAVSQRCGELVLTPSPRDSSSWEILDSTFFPIDDISQDIGLTDRNGNKTQHDFSHCLESHAAITYQGGEVFELRGDDDMWVYVDNRLAADMGGIHFGLLKKIHLDSLPHLAGKLGQTLDVDLYYCSRQPPTAIFGLLAPFRLRSRSLQNLSIRDTAGKVMRERPTVVGPTRLCAWPTYDIPKVADCGAQPPPVTAIPSVWKINGEVQNPGPLQACIDLDPTRFPDQARIVLTAEAEDRQARVALSLVRIAKVKSGVIQGDGRMQSVTLQLDSTTGSVGVGLQVDFKLGDQSVQAWVEPPASLPISANGPWVSGPTQVPGPWGLTTFSPVQAMVTQSVLGQIFRQPVTLVDAVSPVLLQAELQGMHYLTGRADQGFPSVASEPGSQQNPNVECGPFSAALELRMSEPVLPEGLALGVFMGKLHRGEMADVAAHAAQCLVVDRQKRRLLLSDAFAARLEAGDSLSLGAMATDSFGTPARLHFVAIDLPSPLQVSVSETQVERNPAWGQAFIPLWSAPVLVPVTFSGAPVLADPVSLAVTQTQGPIFHWQSLAPLSEMQISLFDQLGNFVAKVHHAFTDAEWQALAAHSNSETKDIRLMLYPISAKGQRLATGVYIAKVEGRVRDGSLISVKGKWTRIVGSAFSLQPIRFGYVRAD